MISGGKASRVLFPIAVLAVAMASAPAAADIQERMSEEQLAALIEPAVVAINVEASGYVEVPFTDGTKEWSNLITVYAGCTGFAVSPDGYIATAGHCVQDSFFKQDIVEELLRQAVVDGWMTEDEANQLHQVAKANWTVEGENSGDPIMISVEVLQPKSASGIQVREVFDAQITNWNPFNESDLALLKIETSTPLPVLEVANADPPTGTQLLSVGFPAQVGAAFGDGAKPSFKTGTISSNQVRGGYSRYEVESGMEPGMSGGPTVDMFGRVLGVNSSGFDGTSINFITDTTDLAAYLARFNIPTELSQTDVAYRAGLNAYFAGDYTAAATELEKVVSAQPANWKAQSFLTEAKAKAPAEPPADSGPKAEPAPPAETSAGIPTWVWIAAGGGALLVLLMGGLMTILLLQRKPPAPVPPPVDPVNAGPINTGPV